MTEAEREVVFRALLGPTEGMPADVVRQLEEIAGGQVREIEPAVDGLLRAHFLAGLDHGQEKHGPPTKLGKDFEQGQPCSCSRCCALRDQPLQTFVAPPWLLPQGCCECCDTALAELQLPAPSKFPWRI